MGALLSSTKSAAKQTLTKASAAAKGPTAAAARSPAVAAEEAMASAAVADFAASRVRPGAAPTAAPLAATHSAAAAEREAPSDNAFSYREMRPDILAAMERRGPALAEVVPEAAAGAAAPEAVAVAVEARKAQATAEDLTLEAAAAAEDRLTDMLRAHARAPAEWPAAPEDRFGFAPTLADAIVRHTCAPVVTEDKEGNRFARAARWDVAGALPRGERAGRPS